MVKSMTGYGRSRETLHQRDITVEVRSVNNRFLDCTVKMPRAYVFAEDAVKTRVRSAVSRGKVDVFVTIRLFPAPPECPAHAGIPGCWDSSAPRSHSTAWPRPSSLCDSKWHPSGNSTRHCGCCNW